ncbi:hypothetical protein RB4740 [Rhodopirellula baltica SH 1]|uniref:Uncharacterized protein n=1 Tax=Rhodopirellula baltica (strain DSM 10527 / NCIMB 13988 / SH1) TaxID=243090 RepID=Q7US29_RHOBA|nr:hypothetical protein RB4740 [Rhodopirellula baltica SH 1]
MKPNVRDLGLKHGQQTYAFRISPFIRFILPPASSGYSLGSLISSSRCLRM